MRDAQTILPIPYAVVQIEETGAVTEADAHGEFVFASLPDGEYHLCVQRIGYTRTCGIMIRIGPEEFMAPIVQLVPQPLNSRGIEVLAEKTDFARPIAASSEVITADAIRRSGANSAAEALRLVPSVEIVSGGTSATQVSIRGSRPDAVAVLVDGVPLAPSGQPADLSSIPASNIEKIEILKGPQAAYAGANAWGGAILITTRSPGSQLNAEAVAGFGSFGHELEGVSLNGIGAGSHRLRANVQNEFTRGDFPYFDTLYEYEAVRENNWMHRQNYSARGDGLIGSRWMWRAGASHTRTHAGSPGPLYELTPSAYRRERRERYSASLEKTFAVGRAEVSYARSRSWSYYDNTGAQPQRTETDASEDLCRVGLEWQRGIIAGAALNAEYAREHQEGVDHRNPAYSFGTAARDNYALTWRFTRDVDLRYEPVRNIRIAGGYRYDQSETNADYPRTAISLVIDPPQRVWRVWSRNVNAALGGTVSAVAWHVNAGYGKTYKRPGLLDLFLDESYLTRGNPGLRPERAEQTEVGYGFGVHRKISFDISQQFFWSRFTDLIYWRLGAGRIWSPANIGRAHIDGREDVLRLRVLGSALELELRHLFQDHRNTSGEANTDSQPLPFRYRHKTSLSLKSSWRWGYAEVARRWYDRRYLREAGTVARSLDPYSVTDLCAGLSGQLWDVEAAVSLRVENIEDVTYEVIERQPMPGRNLRLNIQFGL